MRVKKWVDGYLVLEGDAVKGAEEAFKERRYVEAFALLHGIIDWWMIDLIQMKETSKGIERGPEGLQRLNEIYYTYPYRFKESMKYLRDNGIITQQEYERLREFNELRDLVIHRLVMYSYQPNPRNRIDEATVTKGFKEGRELADLLMSKTGSALDR
jgi:hypothetical protein